MRIDFMTDEALIKLRADLHDNLGRYRANDQAYFIDILGSMDGLKQTRYTCPDFTLDMSAEDPRDTDVTNIRRLYGAMRELGPAVASDERLWTAFSHNDFWDYVQYRQRDSINKVFDETEGAKKQDAGIGSSFFFTNGHRRSLFVHCLSRLWWMGYVTYDEEARDPFHLTSLFEGHAFASTAVLFSSSNLTSNKQLGLGVLDSIAKRQEMGEKIERKHFVAPLRYLNNMGGLVLLDMLSREDVSSIVDEYLASDEFAKLKLDSKNDKVPEDDDDYADDEEDAERGESTSPSGGDPTTGSTSTVNFATSANRQANGSMGGMTISQRAKTYEQPRYGFVPIGDMRVQQFRDGRVLAERESLQPWIVNEVVKRLVEVELGFDVEDVFKASLVGAQKLSDEDLESARHFVSVVSGVDDKSIEGTCQLVAYSSFVEIGERAYQIASSSFADEDTFKNIRIMVQRSKAFFAENGPVILSGFDVEGGYTDTVSRGKGDFLTDGAIWDYRASANVPDSSDSLRVLMQYLMGLRSVHPEFQRVTRIGMFNPRRYEARVIRVAAIQAATINAVNRKVIGYAR